MPLDEGGEGRVGRGEVGLLVGFGFAGGGFTSGLAEAHLSDRGVSSKRILVIRESLSALFDLFFDFILRIRVPINSGYF